jgi:hypothetical protein
MSYGVLCSTGFRTRIAPSSCIRYLPVTSGSLSSTPDFVLGFHLLVIASSPGIRPFYVKPAADRASVAEGTCQDQEAVKSTSALSLVSQVYPNPSARSSSRSSYGRGLGPIENWLNIFFKVVFYKEATRELDSMAAEPTASSAKESASVASTEMPFQKVHEPDFNPNGDLSATERESKDAC